LQTPDTWVSQRTTFLQAPPMHKEQPKE